MYIFKHDYIANGYYEECIYDLHPGVGNYTHDIERKFKEGDLLEAIEISKGEFKLCDSSGYGVSSRGCSAYLMIPVEQLLNENVIAEISEEEFEKRKKELEKEELGDAYQKSILETTRLKNRLSSITEIAAEKGCGKSLYHQYIDEMDNFVFLILQEIHAKAEYVKACL